MRDMSRAIRHELEDHGANLQAIPTLLLREYVQILGAFYFDLKDELARRGEPEKPLVEGGALTASEFRAMEYAESHGEGWHHIAFTIGHLTAEEAGNVVLNIGQVAAKVVGRKVWIDGASVRAVPSSGCEEAQPSGSSSC